MSTKIRLQRYGKKGQPFYHIVIADGRAPRDGRFIERIGAYNPLTIPATIELDFNKALAWLEKGAQPTDTTRAILSYQGVLYKYHLIKGVKKGAFTTEQADIKFDTWMQEKQSKIQEKMLKRKGEQKDNQKKRLEDEVKVNEDRSKALQAKRQEESAALRAKAEEAVAAAQAALTPETPATEAQEQAPETPAAE